MSRTIPYDPTRRALYKPCADAISLDPRAARNEALLCAELSRLIYCPFEQGESMQQEIMSQLAGIGFSHPPQFFDKNGLQACFAVDPNKQIGVLVYRGTQSNDWKDIIANLKAAHASWDGSGCVHNGFANMLKGAWADIQAALDASSANRILYTGHSLGAALATLSAALRRPDALYTFGSPRVGDAEFAASMTDVMHERYVDCCDGVPTVPPASWSYEHVGELKYIDQNGMLGTAISPADIESDQREAEKQFALQYALQQPANALLRSAADHAPVNYIHALRTLR